MSLIRRRMMMNRKGEEGDIYSERYLTIEALEDGLTVDIDNDGFEYCIDGSGEWIQLSTYEKTETINTGQKLHFRGNLIPDAEYGIGSFSANKNFNVTGNAMSLLFGDEGYLNNSLEGKKGALRYLFYQCDKLKNVSPNLLPATTLSDACYANMFEGCDGLIKPPELPAVNLTYECYYCMFASCNSITIAPILPATTLAKYCYEGMFQVCRNLNYIKMLATDISADGCMDYWVYGVASTGTFVKNKDATWDVRGENGIPEGWTVKTDNEESGGNSLFPATIIYSPIVENIPNYTIAQYFWDTYPDMVVDISGLYTPITEDVTIQGTNYCDGKVVGVAKWYVEDGYQALLFYTENSIGNFYALKVILQVDPFPQGVTSEWFFD